VDGFPFVMGVRLSRPLPPMTPTSTVRSGLSGVDKHAIKIGEDRCQRQNRKTCLGMWWGADVNGPEEEGGWTREDERV
jgi:hypothetical protein